MKYIRTLLIAAGLGYSVLFSAVFAEDIDIYAETAANTGIPNVLFVIDNGANFSADAGAACSSYSKGGSPSLGSTGAGVQQCALVDVIEALPEGTVNIGILVGNANNFAQGYSGMSAADLASYTACDQSTGYGGCVVQPLTLMNATNKAKLSNFIKAWKISGSDSSTSFNVKAGGNKTGNMMQEAWAYYNGKTGMSGRSYSGTKLDGCQRNFVIFIANAAGTSGTPADTPTGATEADPSNSTRGLTSSQVAATTEQKAKIIDSFAYDPATCGSTSFGTLDGKADNWADEWARLMNQQDGSAEFGGTQNIISYTIGIIDTASCKPDYPTLMTSTAKYGGGKYFQTSSAADVTAALTRILNEIQAVNSVFASATLPVSVNAQGTYLNQIFLGMFRPDASANPRWLGNLKQYQFVLSGTNPSTAELKLGDSTGTPALSPTGTGFFDPAAISFWTSKDTSKAPDDAVTGGFYINQPNPIGHDHYDTPDGELVERGAVAQKIRLESLKADFAATAATTSNPRRLYTYCPSGSACKGALSHASNAFGIENAGIAAASLGNATSARVQSIVRSGTSAVVTTVSNHGFADQATVTISGADHYNVTQKVTVTGSKTFTITGLDDFPPTTSTGVYTFSSAASAPVSVSSITRGAAGTANTAVVTVVTSAAHGFNNSDSVSISGAVPPGYNVGGAITLDSSTQFKFPASAFTVTPTTPSVNAYSATVNPTTYPSQSVAMSAVSNAYKGTTAGAHGFHVGQSIVVSGTGVPEWDKTLVVTAISGTSFNVDAPGGTKAGDIAPKSGQVIPDPTPQPIAIGNITRSEAAGVTTVTVTGNTSKWFGEKSPNTKVVNIAYVSGSSANEAAYAKSAVTITCTNNSCTSFTYTLTPTLSATGTLLATKAGGVTVTVPAGSISRSGTTATANVNGVSAGAFVNGQIVSLSASSPSVASESEYAGDWTVACTGTCTSLTLTKTVVLSPPLSATPTGNYISAYGAGTTPDKSSLVKWVRGQDNFGDELGPNNTIPAITVRPSVHGDVLHSRPVVVNYGDENVDPVPASPRGLVVYYGSNDGVFHAVNGSQTESIGTVPPGGELWGLVLPEHFGKLNRQRINNPELKLSVTALADAQPKDYFVDGSVGTYQKLNADGSINKAYLYLTMRRGGQFMYALDVTTPTAPRVVWKIDTSGTTSIDASDVETVTADEAFAELGQTWSRPRLTLVKGYANPVLIFGAGYDVAQDSEPPGTDSSGRGIYIIDALTGVRVWSAAYGATAACTGPLAQNVCVVPEMQWSIPSDVSFVDRNNDGKTDRLYVGDTGGNMWRVDLEPTTTVSGTTTANITPDYWKVTKLAALGCIDGAGPCTVVSGTQPLTTPRKFFYPPNVVAVGATGVSGSYDAVMVGSGDREHPLKTSQSYNVKDRFYVVKDTFTGPNGSVSPITEVGLYNGGAVSGTTAYDGSLGGFYLTFATGEKAVNASVTLRGTTYFGTNAPKVPTVGVDDKSCKSNLGTAKGYALDPFKGTFGVTEFDGGGLPPSPTAGVVSMLFYNTTTQEYSTVKKEFCVGCGGGGGGTGADSKSSLGAGNPAKAVPKNTRRSYWYRK